VKVVCGLGNPGPDYQPTRHNVGWWVLDFLQRDWGFPPFRRERAAYLSDGQLGERPVRLMKPRLFMNRSGAALAPLRALGGFDPTRDLLVVVDDANLDVGRVRFRPGGSAGGHNGLKSVEAVLGTQQYPRLRIGIGAPPPGTDLADYVLSPFPPEDEERIRALFPELSAAIRLWVEEGTEAAMRRSNR